MKIDKLNIICGTIALTIIIALGFGIDETLARAIELGFK